MTPAANCSGESFDRCRFSHSDDQAARAFQIEREISAQKTMRLQPSQNQIRIRHRGLRAAAIADRAGIGSSGFRPYAQRSAGVEARDGASAGAHGVNIEHGHANRQAGNLGLAAGAGFAVHQRHIGRSAAHVERDDSFESAAARHGRGSHHSARRPGEHGAHRFAGGRTEGGDPAARLHDENAGVLLTACDSRFSR